MGATLFVQTSCVGRPQRHFYLLTAHLSSVNATAKPESTKTTALVTEGIDSYGDYRCLSSWHGIHTEFSGSLSSIQKKKELYKHSFHNQG